MSFFDFMTYIYSIVVVPIFGIVQLTLVPEIRTAIRNRALTFRRALLVMSPGIAAAVILLVLFLWPSEHSVARGLLIYTVGSQVIWIISKNNAAGWK